MTSVGASISCEPRAAGGSSYLRRSRPSLARAGCRMRSAGSRRRPRLPCRAGPRPEAAVLRACQLPRLVGAVASAPRVLPPILFSSSISKPPRPAATGTSAQTRSGVQRRVDRDPSPHRTHRRAPPVDVEMPKQPAQVRDVRVRPVARSCSNVRIRAGRSGSPGSPASANVLHRGSHVRMSQSPGCTRVTAGPSPTSSNARCPRPRARRAVHQSSSTNGASLSRSRRASPGAPASPPRPA